MFQIKQFNSKCEGKYYCYITNNCSEEVTQKSCITVRIAYTITHYCIYKYRNSKYKNIIKYDYYCLFPLSLSLSFIGTIKIIIHIHINVAGPSSSKGNCKNSFNHCKW